MSDDYEVGYGKPPKDKQFKKGQSGNPKGRTKGTKNFISDRPFGINIKPACDAHDKRYSRLSWTKAKADEAFLEDLLNICRRTFPNRKSRWIERYEYAGCVSIVTIYYSVVRLFGQGPYDRAQKQARENNWK